MEGTLEGASSHRSRRYAGFISYSQKDKRWAKRIHRALEAYRLPRGLPELAGRRRLGRFFRDDDELAGTPSLGAALEEALDDSEALIVICSPNAARSHWVDEEIRHFKRRGEQAKVFAVIVGGRPDASNDHERCFPRSLLRKVTPDGDLTDEPDEPLAPDASKDTFPRLVTRLAAGLAGVEFDTLWQRERRRLNQRNAIAAGAASLIIGGTVGGIFLLQQAEQDRLIQESTRLASEAHKAMENNRPDEALELVVEALPDSLSSPSRPVVPIATAALSRLMADNPARGIVARFDEPVSAIRPIDKTHLAVRLEVGTFKVVDAQTGELKVTIPKANDGLITWIGYKDLVGIATVEGTARVYNLTSGQQIASLALDPKSEWSFAGTFSVFSPSGRYIFARSQKDRTKFAILELDTHEPVRVANAPFIDKDAHLEAVFIGEETVAFSWHKERRQGLGLWRVGKEAPKLLTAVDRTPPCDGAPSINEKRNDSTALALDGSILSHAQPIGEADWCVSSWDAATGSQRPAVLFEFKRYGSAAGVLPVAADLFALPGSTFSRAHLRNTAGTTFDLGYCSSNFGLSQLSPQWNAWSVDPEAGFAACATGKSITVLAAPDFTEVGELYGHNQEVKALAYDAQTNRLWSAGDDGVLRSWTINKIRGVEPGLTPVLEAVFGKHIAVLFRDTKGTSAIRVYSADGTPVSPRIAFQLMSEPDSASNAQYRVNLTLLADEKTLAVAEGFYCGWRGCPPTINHRLTVFDVASGKKISEQLDVAAGDALSSMPIALNVHPNRSEIALRLKRGDALILDAKTGKPIRIIKAPAGEKFDDAAFAHGSWWLLSSGHPDEFDKRQARLVRLNGNGKPEIIETRKAQGARLLADPDGATLFVEHNRASARPQMTMSLIGDNGRLVAVDPAGVPFPGEVQHIIFKKSTKTGKPSAALFFGKGERIRYVDVQTGEIQTLTAIQPSTAHSYGRIDDPAGRAFLGTNSYELSILPFEAESPLCPKLNGMKIDEAAISADGRLLALESENRIVVYDLESCVPVRTSEIDPTSMSFVGDSSLWIRTDNRLQVLEMQVDQDALLAAARRLRASSSRR